MDGEIDPAELSARLSERADRGSGGDEEGVYADTDDLRIVDIRDRRAFDRGHIPGSECVPFPELTGRVGELDGAARIVTVCPHGIASKQAAQLIGSYAGTADARVESLRGGIEAWERSGGELVRSAPKESAATDDEGPDAPF